MGFFDKLISALKPENIEEPKSVHEFIWTNPTSNDTGPKDYIGAELYGSFLTFYLINPKGTKIQTIKAYELSKDATDRIDTKWFDYTMTIEKEKILVFDPTCDCCQVFTDCFPIMYNGKIKDLEITIPYNYITHDED